MEKQKINRINELYRKSKAEGLTEAEKKRTESTSGRVSRTGKKESARSAQ